MDTSKLMCTRQGCRKEYIENENTETSCRYHDGKPIFHDLKKGWTCCGVVVYDWDEFTKIQGCKVASHCNNSANNQTEFFKSQTVNTAQKGIENSQVAQQQPKDIGEYERKQKQIEEEKKKKEMEKPKEIIVRQYLFKNSRKLMMENITVETLDAQIKHINQMIILKAHANIT